jgi:hypothetical protein
MSDVKPDREVIVAELAIVPRGSTIDADNVITVELDTDGESGEFVRVSESARTWGDPRFIEIAPDEWPMVRHAIDKLFDDIRQRETLRPPRNSAELARALRTPEGCR